MNKQIRSRIILAALAVLTALAFTACADLLAKPVSISERLTSFTAELNKANRSELWNNLDSAAANFSKAKPSKFWDDAFGTDIPFTLGAINASDPNAVTAKLTSANKLFDYTVTFGMSSTGTFNPVYLIKSISYTAGTTPITVFN